MSERIVKIVIVYYMAHVFGFVCTKLFIRLFTKLNFVRTHQQADSYLPPTIASWTFLKCVICKMKIEMDKKEEMFRTNKKQKKQKIALVIFHLDFSIGIC